MLGINHPIDPVTGIILVMTTDFLVSLKNDGITSTIAISVKDKSELNSHKTRTQDKLEIERQYWTRRNIVWFIFTNEQVDARVVKNLEWMLLGDQSRENIEEEQTIEADVVHYLLKRQLLSPSVPLKRVCEEIDRINGYILGTSLAVSRRLMARKKIVYDLTIEIPQDAPLSRFSINGGYNE